MDGYGIYKFKDGSICAGFWTANQLNGFGKLIFPDVKCYVGFFENNYKNGFGISLWFKEKKAFVGFWKNNKQNDYLTTKFARKNDLWFHTKDIPGSHTVIICNGKEPDDASEPSCKAPGQNDRNGYAYL